MKQKLLNILIAFLVVWFLVFLIDMLSFHFYSKPVFAVFGGGGDCTVYNGLGYSMVEHYPEQFIDNPLPVTKDVEYHDYIVMNVLLIACIIWGKIRQRIADKAKQ